MKVLFTIVSIDCGNEMYLNAAKNLIIEILNQTNYDVLLSTNNIEYYSSISDDRLFIRNNIESNSVFRFGPDFNYNLKHHAFKDIPQKYDYLIYLDCDIKLEGWSNNSVDFLNNIISNYDFAATRLNCVLLDEINYYLKDGNALFKHKIEAYNILNTYDLSHDIMNSKLPSEHFLILKNNPEKIIKFQKKWKELNDYLQSINCNSCAWGDGFEIGISARYAELNNTLEINQGDWSELLGFKFNGNKY
jgi:hypothetical protein